jgi:hypothetical protein
MKIRAKLAVAVAAVMAMAIAAPVATGAAKTKAEFKKECESNGGQYVDMGSHVVCYLPDVGPSGSLCISLTTKKGNVRSDVVCI